MRVSAARRCTPSVSRQTHFAFSCKSEGLKVAISPLRKSSAIVASLQVTVPVIGAAQPVRKLDPGPPAETEEATAIQQLAGGAIRLARIPFDAPLIPHDGGNGGRQLADRIVLADSQVDR